MTTRWQELAADHGPHGWVPVDLAEGIARVRFECPCGWTGWVDASLADPAWLAMARMRYRVALAKARVANDAAFAEVV